MNYKDNKGLSHNTIIFLDSKNYAMMISHKHRFINSQVYDIIKTKEFVLKLPWAVLDDTAQPIFMLFFFLETNQYLCLLHNIALEVICQPFGGAVWLAPSLSCGDDAFTASRLN